MEPSRTASLPVAVASDHGGFHLKNQLLGLLKKRGLEVVDLGCDSMESVDYPDFAIRLAGGITAGKYAWGVLVCGTGLGMSMAANRFKGVRAAVCTNAYMARMARAHNDANVLCMGERVVGAGLAEDILNAFMETGFEGSRHERRIGKIEAIQS
jgi:ribose 5-phosphate isomerase B